MTRMAWASGGRSWSERCIPPNPIEETAGAPAPSDRSSKAELFREAAPVGEGDGPVVLERREGGENLRAGTLNPAVAQLADHAGEALVISRGVHLAVLEHDAQMPQLFRDPRGGYGLERPALLV